MEGRADKINIVQKDRNIRGFAVFRNRDASSPSASAKNHRARGLSGAIGACSDTGAGGGDARKTLKLLEFFYDWAEFSEFPETSPSPSPPPRFVAKGQRRLANGETLLGMVFALFVCRRQGFPPSGGSVNEEAQL